MNVQREWFEKDYYRVLGVSPSASAKEITAAYRKLARELHPDANPGDTAAEDRFKEVSSAYDVVGDPERRLEYDKVRQLGPVGAQMGGGGPNFGGATFSGADVGDLLGNLFGRGETQSWGPGGPFSQGPQRGGDLETELHISFEDAMAGVTTSVHLITDARCNDCGGSGAAEGTSPRVCSDCAGRGTREDNQGFFSMSRPCLTCNGRGSFIDTPCATCSGSGITTRPRVVKVRLPEGVKDGQQIRLKGKGGPGRSGGPAGDLYVRVRVDAHPTFGREGDNLTVKVPITFWEAALGADIRVPTLNGGTVTIRVPAGTPSGRSFRVKGHGVQTATQAGDLLATVEVVVPTELNAMERAALEALRDANGVSPRETLGQ